jgi:hypothetical protein
MPNWCDTTYKCVGEKKEVESLYNLIQQMENADKSIVENGFGKMWLGNLVTLLGCDWKEYRCRGEIYSYMLEHDVLTICQSTAWCEQEGVRHAIEKKLPSIKVYYLDEEPGCENYTTNDASGICFPMRYRVENYNETEDFNNLEEVAEYFSELTEQPVAADLDTIQACIKDYVTKMQQEEDEDYQCLLYEYRLVEC